MGDEPTNKFQGAFIMVSGVSLMKDYSFQDYGVSGDACDFQYVYGVSKWHKFFRSIFSRNDRVAKM